MTDRPSAWLAGFGVGLCLVAGCGVVVTLAGLVAAWQLYAALFGLGLGGTVALDFGLTAGHWWRASRVAVRLDEARAWANELANQAQELVIQAQMTSPEPDKPDSRAMAVVVERWFSAGELVGFTLDKMTAAEVCSQPAWQKLRDFYVAMPEREPVLVDRGGNIGTAWGWTWTIGKLRAEIIAGTLPLPPGPLPSVNLPIAPQRNANTRKSTQKSPSGVVVEGVSRPAD